MKNVWRFKIDLESESVFEDISREYGVVFPEDLKEFIVENNAASPVKNCVDINGVERVYSETLSFNKTEEDATAFEAVKNTIKDRKLIPFALDPFGNIFCYSLETGKIAFYEHEEGKVDKTNIDLNSFILELH